MVILMDQSRDTVEETDESVNPRNQGPSVSVPSDSVEGDRDVPVVPTETLLKISHGMARILDQLTALKTSIDMLRKHEAEDFLGTSLDESNKADYWLEKLRRVLDEVKCPLEQMATCAVSLMQGTAYNWWKLVLRHPLLPDLITLDFFVKEFQMKFIIDAYR